MVTSLVGSAMVNALAFSVGGWLMSKIDKPNYLAETRRHNEAIEALTQAREKFIEEETQRKDHLAKLKRELAEANQDEIATNRALDILKSFERTNPPLSPPLLQDFYEPGEEQKKYNTIAAVFLALLADRTIFLVYWYFIR